jgi:DNA primase
VARITPDSVQAVKAAADMLDVVGARTRLKKVGARYVGRCPFHEERTPSFSVNAVEKLYYCFGCGKGGDLITFVQETEGLDFTAAVEWLADRFRVPLEYEQGSAREQGERDRRERLYRLLDQAASFYSRYLWESAAGEPARRYLAERGFGEEVCREYRLGLAPRSARALAEKAQEKGFSREELLAAGLVNRRGSDYFSGRLIFPLADARGRVVGFGARRLYAEDPLAAKYLNSPEGLLFRKGSLLYGLDRARTAIAKEGRAIVVEGYTDVLALRQAGLQPVVASMGTALTEQQLRELARLARRVYLCFDADAAGEAATLRGMELAMAQGLEVRVVALPEGLDPADAAERFQELLARAESYVLYRVRLELDRSADRQEAFLRVREALARVEDTPDRQEAVRLAADRLDLPPDLQAGLAPRARAATGSVSAKVLEAGERLERDALAGCVAHPQLIPWLAEMSPEHFDGELHRRLRAHLVEGGAAAFDLIPLLAELDARAAAGHIDEATAKELLLRLRERRLRRELARAGGHPQRLRELQETLERLHQVVSSLV